MRLLSSMPCRKIADPERCFPLSAADFARVNPNTGTAPIFRSRRDAALTTAIYDRLPVLVDRSSGEAAKAWPVKYKRMFDMTNDSGLFRTRSELEEKEGAWPVGGNRYQSPSGEWVPLYVGQNGAGNSTTGPPASVHLNPKNLHRPAPSDETDAGLEQHGRPVFGCRTPQYWVLRGKEIVISRPRGLPHSLLVIQGSSPRRQTFEDSMIAAADTCGSGAWGTHFPRSFRQTGTSGADVQAVSFCWLTSTLRVILDYVARQKIQGHASELVHRRSNFPLYHRSGTGP